MRKPIEICFIDTFSNPCKLSIYFSRHPQNLNDTDRILLLGLGTLFFYYKMKWCEHNFSSKNQECTTEKGDEERRKESSKKVLPHFDLSYFRDVREREEGLFIQMIRFLIDLSMCTTYIDCNCLYRGHHNLNLNCIVCFVNRLKLILQQEMNSGICYAWCASSET